MMKDASRLQSLINSILEISAQEKRKSLKDFRLYRADQLLNSVIEESFERFRIGKGNYKIDGEAPCEIAAVKDSLKVVFDNLTDNAFKYSETDLNIEVRMRCDTRRLIIEFADNGIGIPAKEKKKIFRKFYRIDNKNIPNVKGTGLGLYQIRQIIKLHKGRINLVSSSAGEGSIFRIEIPVYKGFPKRLRKILNQRVENG